MNFKELGHVIKMAQQYGQGADIISKFSEAYKNLPSDDRREAFRRDIVNKTWKAYEDKQYPREWYQNPLYYIPAVAAGTLLYSLPFMRRFRGGSRMARGLKHAAGLAGVGFSIPGLSLPSDEVYNSIKRNEEMANFFKTLRRQLDLIDEASKSK